MSRPLRSDGAVWERAKPNILNCLKNCPCMQDVEEFELEEAFEELSEALDTDGYQLARRLDDALSCTDMSVTDVEELCNISQHLGLAFNLIQREWVKENDIEVPFEIGNKVSFTYCGARMTGVVHSVDESLAKVTVAVEGRSGKPVLPVEDVTVAE